MLWLFLISTAFASENWFCTSESSQMVGDQIQACGVAEAKTEDLARAKALESAKAEFQGLCSASTECPGHKITVEPKRTTCEQEGKSWKCYRMVFFTIGTETSKGGLKKVAKIGKHTPIGTATGEQGDYTPTDFWRDWGNTYMRPQ